MHRTCSACLRLCVGEQGPGYANAPGLSGSSIDQFDDAVRCACPWQVQKHLEAGVGALDIPSLERLLGAGEGGLGEWVNIDKRQQRQCR